MFCEKCGEKLTEENHSCTKSEDGYSSDDLPEKNNPSISKIVVVGLIFYALEVIGDYFIYNVYIEEIRRFLSTEGVDVSLIPDLGPESFIFPVVLLLVAVALSIQKKKGSYYNHVILGVGIVSFVFSTLFFAPILLIIGGVTGLRTKN